MSDESSDEAALKALGATLKIIGDAELQAKLQDDSASDETLEALGLAKSARPMLLNIVNRIDYLTRQKPGPGAPVDRDTSDKEKEKETREKIEKMLFESFDYIRWSFWLSLSMSVALFLVGLVFLIIAVVQSSGEGAVSTATLTIAGVGIADFVLLFYTKPWQDISTNLSNTQQVKIIATTYLTGTALIQKGKPDAFGLLEQLTKTSVSMLEEFAEERATVSTTTSGDKES